MKNVDLGKELSIIFLTYTERGTLILKETHWFAMKATGNENLIPQTEEDILEAKWVNKEELEECKKNSYPGIVEMLDLLES